MKVLNIYQKPVALFICIIYGTLFFWKPLFSQELTENNAMDWGSFADIDQANTSTTNNAIYVQEGNYSVELNTQSGFATGLNYPKQANANWNLTGKTLSFAFYAINNSPFGFQEPVKVRLYTGNDYFEYVHHENPAPFVWITHQIKLTNSSYQNWNLNTVGTPDLCNINQIEFIFDTWDYGFLIYLDGVKFEECDSVNALTNQLAHPQYFIDAGSSSNNLFNLNDFFDGLNCGNYKVVKRSPGLNATIQLNTLSVSPSTNFLGSTYLELSATCTGILYIDTIVVNTQITETMASNCNKQIVNLGIYNFNPIMPQYNNMFCHEAYNWNDPIELTEQYIETIVSLSNNYVLFNLAEWQWINEWPIKGDGFVYDVNSYDDCWVRGINCHSPDIIDYPANISNYGIDEKVSNNEIDEVWFWGGPHFGYFESAMAGPGAYWINGTPYPNVNSNRPFAVMGFNYERGLAEMLHSNGHRAENHMKRAYNNTWNEANPTTNWDYFTANVTKTLSTTTYGVGNIHFPPNGAADYDYVNTNTVMSTALDWINYPNLTGAATPMNRSEWGGPDYHLNYMKFWFDLLPKFDGINPADGRLNNWWKYHYDFSSYHTNGTSINNSFNIANQIPNVELPLNFGSQFIADISCFVEDIDVANPQISVVALDEGIQLKLTGNNIYAFSEDGFTGTVNCVAYICDGNFSDTINFQINVTSSCVAEVYLTHHVNSEIIIAADLIESTAIVLPNIAVVYDAPVVGLLNGFTTSQNTPFSIYVNGCTD